MKEHSGFAWKEAEPECSWHLERINKRMITRFKSGSSADIPKTFWRLWKTSDIFSRPHTH